MFFAGTKIHQQFQPFIIGTNRIFSGKSLRRQRKYHCMSYSAILQPLLKKPPIRLQRTHVYMAIKHNFTITPNKNFVFRATLPDNSSYLNVYAVFPEPSPHWANRKMPSKLYRAY